MSALLSFVALAGLALTIAGMWLLFARRQRRRGWLMIAAGLLVLFNLWSWGGLPGPR